MVEDDFDEFESLEADASEAEAEERIENPQPIQPQPQQRQQQQRQSQPQPQFRNKQSHTHTQAQQAPIQSVQKRKPRYTIEHQPEVLMLIDSLTNEATPLKVETNIKDDGLYLMLTKILNDQDTVIVSGGYQ